MNNVLLTLTIPPTILLDVTDEKQIPPSPFAGIWPCFTKTKPFQRVGDK